MSEDQQYIQAVKAGIDKPDDLVVMEKLIEVNKVDTELFSINARTLWEVIDSYRFEHDDGILDAGWTPEYKDWDDAAQSISSQALKQVKQILADIEAGKGYRREFWIDFVYGKLQNDNYEYKTESRKIQAKNLEEADQQREDLETSTPKPHPANPGFTLEDVRLYWEIVYIDGTPVFPE